MFYFLLQLNNNINDIRTVDNGIGKSAYVKIGELIVSEQYVESLAGKILQLNNGNTVSRRGVDYILYLGGAVDDSPSRDNSLDHLQLRPHPPRKTLLPLGAGRSSCS
jgi:hypothetical protein